MLRRPWQKDASVTRCTQCAAEFGYKIFKHHCRKCGLVYCDGCTRHKLIVPEGELVIRPRNWLQEQVSTDEDNFRAPQRICDGCAPSLRGLQKKLQLEVSRANMVTTVDLASTGTSMPQADFYLENEIRNAVMAISRMAKTEGEEKIPKEMLEVAKGVVFLTIVKAGFMFTGRYGTGLVVAKLPDGQGWSAPSAVTISGMGWGLQIGGEKSDVMLILSTDAAVETFKSRGQVSVGAELGVSAGPFGRSVESDLTAGNKGAAHAFSYAHSQGLYFGASLEACAIGQRKDVNRAFYGERVGASALLSGEYPIPLGAEPLYKALDAVLFDGRAPPELEGIRRSKYVALNQNPDSMAGPGIDGGDSGPRRSTTASSGGGGTKGTAMEEVVFKRGGGGGGDDGL